MTSGFLIPVSFKNIFPYGMGLHSQRPHYEIMRSWGESRGISVVTLENSLKEKQKDVSIYLMPLAQYPNILPSLKK